MDKTLILKLNTILWVSKKSLIAKCIARNPAGSPYTCFRQTEYTLIFEADIAFVVYMCEAELTFAMYQEFPCEFHAASQPSGTSAINPSKQ